MLHLRFIAGAKDHPSAKERLGDFCSRTTPSWSLAPHGAYLDLTGCGRLLGFGADGPALVCENARRHFGELTGGSGPTPLAARLASLISIRLGAGQVMVVPPGSVESFLSAFPVSVLQNYPRAAERLRSLGIRTLGDLQVVPDALLKAVFGESASGLSAEATGQAGFEFNNTDHSQEEEYMVAGMKADRPLVSPVGLAACGEGLALRALARYPSGPRGCEFWRMKARFAPQKMHFSRMRSVEAGTLGSWRRLLQGLLKKLNVHRQGILALELWAGPEVLHYGGQGVLFASDRKDELLASALGRINKISPGGICTASEHLLERWGVRWYGPAEISNHFE